MNHEQEKEEKQAKTLPVQRDTAGYTHVLVGCEESQTVCAAFRDAGYQAFSCDLHPTRGNPEWHYQQDIMEVIPTRQWDLIILHPDCTAMAVSGNRWYGRGMPMHEKRLQAVEWTLKLWELAKQHSNKVVLENPVSVIFSHLDNVHYVQPWQFGHGEAKKTGFALHGAEPLQPTNIVTAENKESGKCLRQKTENAIGVRLFLALPLRWSHSGYNNHIIRLRITPK